MANIKTLKQSLINKKETIIFAIGLIAGAVINGMLFASSTILLLAATVLLGHVLYKNKKLLNFKNAARKLKDALINNGSINNFIIGCVIGTIAGVLFDVVGFVFASLPLMLLSTAAIVGCLVYKHVTRDIKIPPYPNQVGPKDPKTPRAPGTQRNFSE